MKPIFSLLTVLFLCAAAQAQQPLWVRTGHVGGVCGLIFTPDGKHFISSATNDPRILVWNTATGSYERTITMSVHNYLGSSLALSPDGSTIASGGGSVIYLIDFATGTTTDSIVPNTSEVYLLQFSPSGDTVGWITSGYNGSNFYRYSRPTRQFIDSLPVPAEELQLDFNFRPQIAISADLNTVAYVDGEDTAAVINMRQPDSMKLFYSYFASSVALNWNGSQLAVAAVPTVHSSSGIFDVATGNVLFTWPDTTGPGVPSYLGNSDTIFYPGDSGIWLHIPDSSTDQFIKVTPTSSGAEGFASSYNIGEWVFSPDRATLLSAGVVTALAGGPVASVVSMYQKPTFVESQVTGSCGTITQLRWSPVADTITASDGGGGIRSYGAVSDAVSVGYGPKGERIGGFDYSVKGDSIAFSAFGDDDVEDAGTDYVSFASAGNLIPTDQIIKFEFQAPYLQGLILSPEEKQVVLGNDFEPSFGIWDPGPPALVYPDVYAFSPDGSVLLIGDTNNLAAQSTTSQSLTNLSDPNTSAILGASFAPNGTEIAVIQADQSVEVLGYPACNRIYQLKGHTGTVTGAIFSHDSRYLATSSSDSTMRVWDLLTGKTIATYSYSSPLITAGFSYDSRYVAATDGGTSVIVWDAPGNLKVEEEPPAPTMSLSQNSPNPVLTSTTFSYSVSYSEDVTIRLYDVMGREISMLANGRVDAGTHSVSFNPGAIGSLAPGIYYYRLEAPSGVMTRTIVVE